MVQYPFNRYQPPPSHVNPFQPPVQWNQQNPYYQIDPETGLLQSNIPLYAQVFPMYNPTDPKFQSCRSRCYLLGLTPGTAPWVNCVHSCMWYNV